MLSMLSWHLSGRLESDHNSDPDVIVLANVYSNGQPTPAALCADHGLNFSTKWPSTAFADYTATRRWKTRSRSP